MQMAEQKHDLYAFIEGVEDSRPSRVDICNVCISDAVHSNNIISLAYKYGLDGTKHLLLCSGDCELSKPETGVAGPKESGFSKIRSDQGWRSYSPTSRTTQRALRADVERREEKKRRRDMQLKELAERQAELHAENLLARQELERQTEAAYQAELAYQKEIGLQSERKRRAEVEHQAALDRQAHIRKHAEYLRQLEFERKVEADHQAELQKQAALAEERAKAKQGVEPELQPETLAGTANETELERKDESEHLVFVEPQDEICLESGTEEFQDFDWAAEDEEKSQDEVKVDEDQMAEDEQNAEDKQKDRENYQAEMKQEAESNQEALPDPNEPRVTMRSQPSISNLSSEIRVDDLDDLHVWLQYQAIVTEV